MVTIFPELMLINKSFIYLPIAIGSVGRCVKW